MHIIEELKNKHVVAYFEEEHALRQGYHPLETENIIDALGLLHRMLQGQGIKDAQYTALVDAFVRTFTGRKRDNPANIPAITNTLTVKAAIRANIIEGLSIADVDNLSAGQVTQLANEVADALKSSFDVPKV